MVDKYVGRNLEKEVEPEGQRVGCLSGRTEEVREQTEPGR